MEELLAKARVVREKAVFSRSAVKGGDPSKDYVWVHNSDHTIYHFQALGYSICKDPKVKTAWKKEDGRHLRGDVILMEVDKDFREALKMEAEARSVETLEGSRESFLAFAARKGIPAVDNSRRE